MNNSKSGHVLKVIDYTYTKIHPLLRICDSFFTQMVVAGNLETTGQMPTHIDEDDYINAIISLGDNPIHGGEMYYCDGISKKNHRKSVTIIPFQHGRIQIGFFSDIYHGVSEWNGYSRGTINLCMKKKLTKHFKTHKGVYFHQYVNAGYPSKMFVAT